MTTSLFGDKSAKMNPQMSPVSNPVTSALVTTKPAQQLMIDSGEIALYDPTTGAMASPSMDYLTDSGLDASTAQSIVGGGEQSGFMGNLLKDKYMMGNIAGLASTLMQAAALPSMLKQAKLQNKALSQNIETAKEEQGRRRKNISAFNAFRG